MKPSTRRFECYFEDLSNLFSRVEVTDGGEVPIELSVPSHSSGYVEITHQALCHSLLDCLSPDEGQG